jgi:hypothetical protein
MKAVNITLHISPNPQRLAARLSSAACRGRERQRSTRAAQEGEEAAPEGDLEALAESRWRVTTPRRSHISVTTPCPRRRGHARRTACLHYAASRWRACARAPSVALADADRLRRDLDQLVVVDELHRVLQRELIGGVILIASSLPETRKLVSCLARTGFTTRSLSRDVDADHHALVQRVAGLHEHAAAVVELAERVGHRLAVVLADQHAVLAPSISPLYGS